MCFPTSLVSVTNLHQVDAPFSLIGRKPAEGLGCCQNSKNNVVQGSLSPLNSKKDWNKLRKSRIKNEIGYQNAKTNTEIHDSQSELGKQQFSPISSRCQRKLVT